MAMKKILAVLPLTLVMVGCNAHQQAAAPSPQMASQTAPQFSMGQNAHMASMQASFQQPQMQQAPIQQQMGSNAGFDKQVADLKAFTNQKIEKMGERVRRVERAMIRLDRRMQVVERNELAKVSGLQNGDSQQNQAMGMGRFQPTSYNTQGFGQKMGSGNQPSPFARGAAILSRTPFASRSHVDTQELNGDHVSVAPLQPAQPQQARQASSSQRFASLADTATDRSADTEVAIWTVNYNPRKIWPDRAELAASSEVVTALREGRPVSVFARGARPSSKEFRERVRALSRYLGRVANLESVPIAAMPAEHLNNDTIELLVAN